ncbi:MAG TPA: hypothetical protein VHG51_11995 [Longimicrobiaceae bacterium]|nr:hypothetical protein [Longimicrobiaceae bacterium]
MEPVTVLLDDRRAALAQRAETATQAGAALSLVSAALAGLPAPDPEGAALAAVELLAAALLVAAIVRELLRRPGAAEEAGIGWVSVFAAAALFAEAYHGVYTGGRLSRPTLAMAAVTLAVGLANPWIARRRAEMSFVRVDDRGMEYRASRLRGFRLAWAELASVECDASRITLRTTAGATRRVRLGRYRNGGEAAALLLERAALRGIPGAPPAEDPGRVDRAAG